LRLTCQRLHPLQQALPGLRGRGGRTSGAAVGPQIEAEVTLLLLLRRNPDRRRPRSRPRLLLLGRRRGLLLGRCGPHLAFALIVKLGGEVPRGEPALALLLISLFYFMVFETRAPSLQVVDIGGEGLLEDGERNGGGRVFGLVSG
jgi:hypothetical protein